MSETTRATWGRVRRGLANSPGLSFRLLGLTIIFVFVAEILVFVPSAANFRTSWLNERIEAAQIAALAVEAAPMRQVSDELAAALLSNAQVASVATASEQGRELLLRPEMPIAGDVHTIDLRSETMMSAFADTFRILLGGTNTSFYRIIDDPMIEGAFIEILVQEAPLRADLIAYSQRIFGISLFISGVTGLFIYVALLFAVVRPIRRITQSVEQFRDDPKDWTKRLQSSSRVDEIGRAERALSDMEQAVKQAIHQREHLAELGEAMAKINHDLRNSLAAAQLVSEGLSMSDDPRVKRAVPRLERALQRAIKLAQETLQYGKAEAPVTSLQTVDLYQILEEASLEGLSSFPSVVWVNECQPDTHITTDPDHLHRIIVNLTRNAGSALTGAGDEVGQGHLRAGVLRKNGHIEIEIADDGPGIPERARPNLFKPFSSSTKRDGTGLGLAIAKELAHGMGGSLELRHTGPEGTVFRITLPQSEILLGK